MPHKASQKNIFKDNIKIDVTGNHVTILPNAKADENGTKDEVARMIENLLGSEVLWIACGNNDTISKYGKECDIDDIATKYNKILVEFKGLRFYRSTAQNKSTSCEEIIQ